MREHETLPRMTWQQAEESGRWFLAGPYVLPKEEWMLDNCVRDQVVAGSQPVIVHAVVDKLEGECVWVKSR